MYIFGRTGSVQFWAKVDREIELAAQTYFDTLP